MDHSNNNNNDVAEREKAWVSAFQTEEAQRSAKYERLRDLDLVILDNSVRESTVGQLKGHTAEDKFKIYEEAAKCGFTVMLEVLVIACDGLIIPLLLSTISLRLYKRNNDIIANVVWNIN